MARNTRSGTLVGPGICKKCRPLRCFIARYLPIWLSRLNAKSIICKSLIQDNAFSELATRLLRRMNTVKVMGCKYLLYNDIFSSQNRVFEGLSKANDGQAGGLTIAGYFAFNSFGNPTNI